MHYQLVVKGEIEFDDPHDIEDILPALRGEDGKRTQLEVAIQELDETAKNVTVDLIPL